MRIDFSKVRSYLSCPALYEWVYVKGLRIPPPGAMVAGREIHRTAEKGLRLKKAEKVNPPVEFFRDTFSTFWEEAIKAEEINWRDDNPGEMKDTGISMISLYGETQIPKIEPLEIEFPFELSFTEYQHTLYGRIDIVDVRDFPIDLKTSTRTPNEDAIAKDGQATCYLLAWTSLGHDPKKFRFDYLIRTKKPKLIEMETTRTEAEFNQFLRDMDMVIRGIQAGVFPRNPNNVFCNSKWCGFYQKCFGSKK